MNMAFLHQQTLPAALLEPLLHTTCHVRSCVRAHTVLLNKQNMQAPIQSKLQHLKPIWCSHSMPRGDGYTTQNTCNSRAISVQVM